MQLTSATGKVWMDRNLGASRAGTAATDFNAYGCLYQWGRGNDGHASITYTSSTAGVEVNGNTGTLATSDAPGNALFITGGGDWRSDTNSIRWQENTQVNNPCDTGFRVPTEPEFKAEFKAYNITNGTLAYSKGPDDGFKFVFSGDRNNYYGTVAEVGAHGVVWTSTLSAAYPYYYYVNTEEVGLYENFPKSRGLSVRCIKI